MKALWIDFKRPLPPALMALRFALLAAGVLLFVFSLIQQRQIEARSQALDWQKRNLSQLETRRLPRLQAAPGETAVAGSQDGGRQANEVLHQLNLPWDRLFSALEQSMAAGVVVLSVEPDAKKSAFTLKAAAIDMDTAIDFMKRMQATGLFKGVHLLKQETDEEGGRHPLQFTLSARWEVKP